MRKITKLLCVVLSIMLVFSAAFMAEAKSTSELNAEKQKIQQEIDSAEKKINKIKAEKAETEEYVSALQGKISLLQDKLSTLQSQRTALQNKIDEIQSKINKTVKEIEEAQNEIDKKQAEFEEVYNQYCQRLRAMYVSGNVTTLEVFLSGGLDMSSILTRAQMIKSVSEQDSQTLDELMTKMEEIEKEKQQLREKQKELEADKASLDEQKAELQSSINEISASKSELDSEVSACNAAIRKLDSQTAEIRETIDADESRIKEIESAIKRAAMSTSSAPSSYTPGTGQLAYPTSYRTISAGYPNYKSGAYHGGIDFPCPTGTPVYAADSGYVSLAKHLTYSYGNYVMINHGNGLSTLYAHNSSLVVSEGQAVTKGQLIAYSGSTGNSSGPHCHFEVRLNGNRVNPQSYL